MRSQRENRNSDSQFNLTAAKDFISIQKKRLEQPATTTDGDFRLVNTLKYAN